jgi:glycine reductase
MTKLRVVHYLNQFFAGIGGEDRAGEPPGVREGCVGPGQVLQRSLGDAAEVVATIYCGDDFFNEHEEAAVATIVDLIRGHAPDLVVAGPAFNAGRYGLACGRVCSAVSAQLGIATVTGMFPENPGVELYRQRVHIVASGPTPVSMAGATSTVSAASSTR